MASEERETQVPEPIAMPAPTVWPLVTALGMTLGGAGLVTHVAVRSPALHPASCRDSATAATRPASAA